MKKLLFFCLLAGLVTGLSAKVKVTFTDQWGELGLCSKLPISLDNYRGVKVEFDGTVADNIQLKIQNATDQADTNNYPAQYQPAENGVSQIAIDFDTEHFGSDRTVTVLNLQNKVTSQVVVIIKRIALVKTDGTEEECSYDGSVGWGRTIEVLSDDTPGGDDNPGGDDPIPGVDTGTSVKIEAETMTPGGSYAGTCSSPFAGMAFYGKTDLLGQALSTLGQSGTVYEISNTMLGLLGGALAVVGVVVCPITSGDTAFRSARLILAEITGLDQKKIRNRLLITLPLLGIGAVLTQMDFNVLWRYFSWSNQTLAMVALWVITAYLVKAGGKRWASLLTALPAAFMSAVSSTYILMAKEGLSLGAGFAYPAGVCFAAVLFVIYVVLVRRYTSETA